jgi:hypothetical protein
MEQNRMKSIIKIIFVFAVIIISQGILSAQTLRDDTTNANIQVEKTTPIYVRATAGISLPLGGIAYFRIDYGNLFFAIRSCATGSDDLGFIVGLSAIKKSFYWSIGLGVCKVNSYEEVYTISPNLPKYQESHQEKTSTWGIPAQVDFMFTPSKFVGLGFVLFGDINRIRNFGGVAFCIQVGKLR